MYKLLIPFSILTFALFGVCLYWFVQSERGNSQALYGEWVEQGVPYYVADKFEIRASGIYKRGARLTQHFILDGRELS